MLTLSLHIYFSPVFFIYCPRICQDIKEKSESFFHSSCILESPTRLKLHLAPDICNTTERSYTANNPVNDWSHPCSLQEKTLFWFVFKGFLGVSRRGTNGRLFATANEGQSGALVWQDSKTHVEPLCRHRHSISWKTDTEPE